MLTRPTDVMTAVTRAVSFAAAPLLAVAALLTACEGDVDNATDAAETAVATAAPTATATPSATAEATGTPALNPTPAATPHLGPLVGHPPETRTGEAAVDAVIDAVLAGDVDALLSLARFDDVACVLESPAEGYEPPPVCPDGVSPGTPLPVMGNVGCHGVLRQPDDLHYDLRLASRELRPYAVAAAPGWAGPDAEHYALFPVRIGDGQVWGYALVTGRGGFVAIDLGCAFPPEKMLEANGGTPYLLEPPE